MLILQIIWLVSAIALWGAVHSLLASLKVKELFRRTFGANLARAYRLLYNVFSMISSLPILWLVLVLPDRLVYSAPTPWNFVMMGGQMALFILLLVGVFQTGILLFLGIRQFHESEKPHLVTTGMYRVVRHPLYLLGMVFLWLTPILSVKSIVLSLSLTIYLIVGAFVEERKLIKEFGKAYLDYKISTPMFLPRLATQRGELQHKST